MNNIYRIIYKILPGSIRFSRASRTFNVSI